MYNHVALVGRLGAAPELKRTQNDVAYTIFDVAVPRGYANQDGSRETDWITCLAWRGTAEFVCKYFGKGRPIGIDGTINVQKYEKDGQNRRAFRVVVNNVFFVDSKKSEDTVPEPPPEKGQQDDSSPQKEDEFREIAADDDLPF